MTRAPINPGTVDWTGENPGISLRETEDGPFVCLASFFRVFYSPHGTGHGLVLLWDPAREHPYNACYTDNERLMEWLLKEFVVHFGSYRGNPLVPNLPIRRAGSYGRGGDPRSEYSEVIGSQGFEIRLTWRDLSAPYIVTLPADKSATGVHELYSLFVDARAAEVVVNGQQAAGSAFPRDFYGHQSSTAFLAFSESWVRPK
ncbi:MAG: hypothetical protein ACYC4L_13070 [Chloroflexota bacterium]